MTQANLQAAEMFKRLPACPNSPNCVSSQAEDEDHRIAPFKIKGSSEKAWLTLQQLLSRQPRIEIVEVTDRTLQAEATSLIFRFVDDLDAVLDADAGLIHVRSASRVGYSDFGVNRKRVETLRKLLQAAGVAE